MPVTFFSSENLKKVLFLASDSPQHLGFTYWLKGWLLMDKRRGSFSIHQDDWTIFEADLAKWFTNPYMTKSFGQQLAQHHVWVRSSGEKESCSRYNGIVDAVADWFKNINCSSASCLPALKEDLKEDLIKLLALALALLNVYTQGAGDENCELAEDEKIWILQGYYFWLTLQYQDDPESLMILQKPTTDWQTKKNSISKKESSSCLSCVDSLSLQDRLACEKDSKSDACFLFLEYWLAYYEPGQSLRAVREDERQVGTDFLIPPTDFMRKHQTELQMLDKYYEGYAGVLEFSSPRLRCQ